MRIPEIRNHLLVMADDLDQMAVNLALDADELRAKAHAIREHVRQLHRRKSDKAPKDSDPMTPALRRKIVGYAAAHPYATQAAMARRFNVNIGRISETLKGVRT